MESSVAADDAMTCRLLTTVTVQEQVMEFSYDVSVMRKDKILGYVTYYSRVAPSVAEEASLALALETKLRAGGASLS
jgi:hypothetical protein